MILSHLHNDCGQQLCPNSCGEALFAPAALRQHLGEECSKALVPCPQGCFESADPVLNGAIHQRRCGPLQSPAVGHGDVAGCVEQ